MTFKQFETEWAGLFLLVMVVVVAEAAFAAPVKIPGFQGQAWGHKGDVTLTLDEVVTCGVVEDPATRRVAFVIKGGERECFFRSSHLSHLVWVRVKQHHKLGLYEVGFIWRPIDSENKHQARARLRILYDDIAQIMRGLYGPWQVRNVAPPEREILLWGKAGFPQLGLIYLLKNEIGVIYKFDALREAALNTPLEGEHEPSPF